MRGRLGKFFPLRGFGYLITDSGKKVVCHISNFPRNLEPRDFRSGTRFSFDIGVMSPKRHANAVNIQKE